MKKIGIGILIGIAIMLFFSFGLSRKNSKHAITKGKGNYTDTLYFNDTSYVWLDFKDNKLRRMDFVIQKDTGFRSGFIYQVLKFHENGVLDKLWFELRDTTIYMQDTSKYHIPNYWKRNYEMQILGFHKDGRLKTYLLMKDFKGVCVQDDYTMEDLDPN